MFTSKFRHSVQATVNASKPKSPPKAKSGKKGNWKDQLKLPKSPAPATPFLILNAVYDDMTVSSDSVPTDAEGKKLWPKATYFHYKKHASSYHIKGQERYGDTPCSRGNDPFNPQPCEGCLQMEQGNKQVSLKDSFAFSLVHLVPYHGVPASDYKNPGQFLKKRDSQEYYLNFEECTGRDCNYCRVLKGLPTISVPGKAAFPVYPKDSITTEFGRVRYLEVGAGHLSNLEGWDLAITSKCGTCRGELVTEGFECTSCGTLVIDMERDTRPAEVIAKVVSSPMECPECKHVGMVKEAPFCEACDSAGRTWKENVITDVVCKAKKQGEKAKTTIVLDGFYSIEDFEKEMPSAHKALLKGRPLREVIAELSKPFAFDEIMAPVSSEEQITRLGINYMSSGPVIDTTADAHPGEQNFSR